MTVSDPSAQSGGKLALGIVGVVFAVCCWPLGLILSIVTVAITAKGTAAKTLGYVGLGLAGLVGVIFIILAATGHVHFWVHTGTTSNP
jgi:hypothetical protein